MKKIRIASTICASVAIIGGGALAFDYFDILKGGNAEPEEVKYEIGGKNNNFEIENSIVKGSGLDQFLRGRNMKQCLSDGDGDVYNYTDESGTTWVYENEAGKIFSVSQDLKYNEKTWKEIEKFWKSLDNQQRTYIGYDDLENDEVDWEDEKTDISLTGSNEEFEYYFSRYQSSSYELEDGTTEGFNGTAITVGVTSLEGDNNENEEDN